MCGGQRTTWRELIFSSCRVGLGVKLRSSSLHGKCLTTEPSCQPFLCSSQHSLLFVDTGLHGVSFSHFRPGVPGAPLPGRAILSMNGLSYGVIRVNTEDKNSALTVQDVGHVMPGGESEAAIGSS